MAAGPDASRGAGFARFAAGLRSRLADAVTASELLEATRPEADDVTRTVAPSGRRIGGRVLGTLLPSVVLEPTAPIDAAALCAAWGVIRPIAVSGDVHQATWQVAERGADLPDPAAVRVDAQPILAGRWRLAARLDRRPDGPLPRLVAGASPAYAIAATLGAVIASIEVAPAWRPVELVPATHPDALGLLGARRAAHPHWAAGWDPDAGGEFVVVYEDGRPVAGASIRHEPDRISWASRLCATDGSDPGIGSDLLDALEALAIDAGSSRLRLDSSAFLVEASVPLARHGYVTGPPYDGDADVETWAERTLEAPA